MQERQLLLNLLWGASKHLNKSGYLYIVMRKDQGAKSMIETMKSIYDVNIIEKKQRFLYN